MRQGVLRDGNTERERLRDPETQMGTKSERYISQKL